MLCAGPANGFVIRSDPDIFKKKSNAGRKPLSFEERTEGIKFAQDLYDQAVRHQESKKQKTPGSKQPVIIDTTKDSPQSKKQKTRSKKQPVIIETTKDVIIETTKDSPVKNNILTTADTVSLPFSTQQLLQMQQIHHMQMLMAPNLLPFPFLPLMIPTESQPSTTDPK